MVDIAFLQSIASLLGYATVSVAALSFIFNIRETAKNRKVMLTNTLLSTINSQDGQRLFYELMSMTWVDFDDFFKKYDSSVNPESYIKRYYLWNLFEHVGWQYRKGLVDLETIYYAAGQNILLLWRKYKPIIEEYRTTQYTRAFARNWEYLADELGKMYESLDPEISKNWSPIVKKAFPGDSRERIN
ncbi:MAG: hypothetical protein NTY03_16565 [Candidatus Bathyarchaeota archaeon]|jgi:hypothetical protein|nr:hypothetical protein [Candidatus Bathyarchaeota archaeon]